MTDSPIPPTERPVDDAARIIMLTYGPMESGKGSFWCYVAVKPSQHARFRDAQKNGYIDLRQFEADGFGEIVVSGTGVMPPPDVTRQVARMFGIAIKDLFAEQDPHDNIAAKIAQLKENEQRE